MNVRLRVTGAWRCLRWRPATFAAVAVLVAQPPVLLAETPGSGVYLSEEIIRKDIIGHALDGVYVDGRTWKETYAADSSLDYSDDLGPLTGRWHLNGGVFCMTYDPLASTYCYLVRRAGANCFEFYSVPSDWSRLELPADHKTGWSAKGGRTGEPDGCFDPTV